MTPRRFKYTRFRKGILDFSFECISLLQNDFFKERYLIMVKTELTETPTCAELFLLGIYKSGVRVGTKLGLSEDLTIAPL